MDKHIPYARQTIGNDDIREAAQVLRSDWLTQGPKVKEFEKALSKYTGAKYAVAVSSGTAALHLIMMAMGVGADDHIITSPITFAASANCAIYVGAHPDFVDINEKTYHMDVEKLKNFLKIPSQRKNVKAIIPVHLMGTVVDIERIRSLGNKYGIKVVEDAAHALGAKYRCRGKWYRVGNCRHSDATAVSFHPIKHITTGEGGAVLTNDKKLYEKILSFRHHGIVKTNRKLSSFMRKFSNQEWFYDIPEVGFNYRITDFQCALGLSQLKKLGRFVKKRREIVSAYDKAFSGVAAIRLPYERDRSFASYHLYVIRVPSDKRNGLYSFLRKKNISTQINYIPVHMFAYYQEKFGYRPGNFPTAERYFEECLSLPLYPSLSKKDQLRVIRNVKEFLKA